MRSQAWEWAEGAGLTPTQGEILVLLMQRKGPMRLGEIARETALTAATTSDAVSTLESKGLVEKRRALDDGRALAVRLTARGRTAAKRAAQWPDFLAKAVGTLREDEQALFYRTLLKTIHQLEAQERHSAAPHVPDLHAFRAEQESEEDAASLRAARPEDVGHGSCVSIARCTKPLTSRPRRRPGRSTRSNAASPGPLHCQAVSPAAAAMRGLPDRSCAVVAACLLSN